MYFFIPSFPVFCLIFMEKSWETTIRTNFLTKIAEYDRKISQIDHNLSMKFLQNQNNTILLIKSYISLYLLTYAKLWKIWNLCTWIFFVILSMWSSKKYWFSIFFQQINDFSWGLRLFCMMYSFLQFHLTCVMQNFTNEMKIHNKSADWIVQQTY